MKKLQITSDWQEINCVRSLARRTIGKIQQLIPQHTRQKKTEKNLLIWNQNRIRKFVITLRLLEHVFAHDTRRMQIQTLDQSKENYLIPKHKAQ